MTNYDLAPWLAAWVVATLSMLALAAYRKHLDRLEDTDLHLGTMSPQEARSKVSFNQRVHRIELLGKSFTVMFVALSSVVFALWAYNQWMRSYVP
jgi:sterol desaturase/sphingolipid hydroxylase (fatty acid hydroxylase superfamily)